MPKEMAIISLSEADYSLLTNFLVDYERAKHRMEEAWRNEDEKEGAEQEDQWHDTAHEIAITIRNAIAGG